MAQYRLANPGSGDPGATLDQLRRGMDELFERVGSGKGRRTGAHPPVNLYETADAYVLTAELPGLRSEEIDVALEGSRVTLRGERRIEHPADASLHRLERPSGIFRRTIELPAQVDPDKAEATYRHGVLTFRIPKAKSARPRRIGIRAD